MKKLVTTSKIDLNLRAPGSKSIAQRAIISALLSKGVSTLTGVTLCDDTAAAISLIKRLGTDVSFSDDDSKCIINSSFDINGSIPENLTCNESGLLSRMVISIMSLSSQKVTIHGSGTLNKRPFSVLERPLMDLGAEISLNGVHLPVTIIKALKGGETIVDGSLSSQFLTGLLFALPLAPNNSKLTVIDLKSKPYIDITIDVLSAFGIEIENKAYENYSIRGDQKYVPTTYNIEGDWSAAAILLVAGAIAGKISVSNLNINSTQGDKVILELFKSSNVDFTISENSVTTIKSKIKSFEFDATHCPDLFPIITVLASQADGICCIKGASRLKHKESDRAEVIKSEFAKIGIQVDLEEDLMYVTPGEIKGGEVDANEDHRIAMALAVAGLCSEEGILIDGAEFVSKSYPNFWADICQ